MKEWRFIFNGPEKLITYLFIQDNSKLTKFDEVIFYIAFTGSIGLAENWWL